MARADEAAVAPPGWARDELTAFLDRARHNQWASFHNKPSVKRLVAIDALFAAISNGWTDPGSEIGAYLLLRCHAAFRTSAGLAMAGQAPDAYVQCRSALENAAYALHIFRTPALVAIWLNRHESAESNAIQKRAFQFNSVQKAVEAANADAGKHVAELYRRVIDFGAHPNERSVTGNLRMRKEKDKRVMLMVSQHEDGPELDLAIKTVAQCGLVSLEILETVFPSRFVSLGISAAMLELQKGL